MENLPSDVREYLGRALLCQPAALASTACVCIAWRNTLRKHTQEFRSLISSFPRLRCILMQAVPGTGKEESDR